MPPVHAVAERGRPDDVNAALISANIGVNIFSFRFLNGSRGGPRQAAEIFSMVYVLLAGSSHACN